MFENLNGINFIELKEFMLDGYGFVNNLNEISSFLDCLFQFIKKNNKCAFNIKINLEGKRCDPFDTNECHTILDKLKRYILKWKQNKIALISSLHFGGLCLSDETRIESENLRKELMSSGTITVLFD